jgi:hypothetical protein
VSSPLAIAVVTAVLKDLLNNGLIDNDLAAVGTVLVSALPPDRITTGPTEDSRLNLFLYQVTPNLGWRNAALPSYGSSGERLTNQPLALDLHYLLTAYGREDLSAEILLGYAMEALHEVRVLTRGAIRRALDPANPINVNLIPEDGQGRAAADLADQLEQIKIAPHYLGSEELARLWAAMQSRYRPSVAYQVSTVLIEARRPTARALPVLRRGSDDRGAATRPDLLAPPPAWPTLQSLTVLDGGGRARPSAELGDRIVLDGALLGGDSVTAEFRHSLLDAPLENPADAGSTPFKVVLTLPSANGAAADWPAGSYAVSLRIERAGKAKRWSNSLGFALAPRLRNVSVSGSAASPVLHIALAPEIWVGQRVEVVVGDEPFAPPKITAKTAALDVQLAGIAPADEAVPVRLRVDGAEGLLVRDHTAQPPRFDPSQSITLP